MKISMKKMLAAFLAVSMVVGMTACGKAVDTTTQTTTATTTTENKTSEAANTEAADKTTETKTETAATETAATEKTETPAADTTAADATPAEKIDVNVYVLAGPTGIGAANMMKTAENGEGLENYHFTVVTGGEEIVAKISTGEADIAAIATNLAAKLYKKTSGGIQILAVNTLGVLNVLNYQGESISSMADLKGRKIYTTGQGSNPEFVIRYLLTENGVDPDNDVTIEYKEAGTDLVTVWETDPTAVIIAPQPVATSIRLKFEGAVIALDLTEVWNSVSPDSQLMMGCVVARTEFISAHPEAVEAFLKDYEVSITATNADKDTTGALCEEYGIVAKAAIAKQAIPYCNICFITGKEMKEKLTGYLQVLLNADATSVGGAIPGDDFWYSK